MAEGIKTPHKFNGLNFSIWKVKMTVFLQSLGSQVAKAVTKPFREPDGNEDIWSEIATNKFDANAKPRYVLLHALNDDDIARIIYCKSAHEIWLHLVIMHGGYYKSRAKIDLLCSQYENFITNEEELINHMITKFTIITNGLVSLGDRIDNDQKMRKVIRALPPS